MRNVYLAVIMVLSLVVFVGSIVLFANAYKSKKASEISPIPRDTSETGAAGEPELLSPEATPEAIAPEEPPEGTTAP